ncbi:MAG: hypothetical protein CL811_06325 [Colwelliaceae bacterium]|jgi:hypothetical protein|nr:hypothetical protein [Colwelliaceae bacterium]|tara:strand:+ start:8658 stop:8930 length:273 start_codon:yes stop_codon:yes gene_type:complete
MVDRTSNTTFYPSTDPGAIRFKTNASDGDTFVIPYGVPETVLGMNAEDNDDVIASAAISGGAIVLGLIDDAGAADTADTDINGTVLLKNQ